MANHSGKQRAKAQKDSANAANLAAPQQLVLDLDGFEGPLDMLLHLALAKKLDLSKISVLALAEQYLRFIEQAQSLRLSLAGEYLLMAARLIYIKSRLLLPQTEAAEEAEESAAVLRFRLARLAAMRDAAEKLFRRPLLGRAVFAIGQPQARNIAQMPQYQESLYNILRAYADLRVRQSKTVLRLGERRRSFWTLKQARSALSHALEELPRGEWLDLSRSRAQLYAAADEGAEGQSKPAWRSALAGAFVAGLELAREGKAELRQSAAFAPLYLRGRSGNGG